MLTLNKLGMAIAGVMLVSMAGVHGTAQASDSRGMKAQPLSTPATLSEAAPARFVVKYRQGADRAVINRGLDNAVARAGLDRAVLATATGAARSAVTARHRNSVGFGGWEVVTTSRGLNPTEASAFMGALRADGAVLEVEQDRIFHRMPAERANFNPNDPHYQYQWHFNSASGGVRAPEAWALPNSRGAGVVVAILDTGIVQNHLDLAANVIPGYDMITDTLVSRRPTAERVPGGWDIGDWVETNYCGSNAADTSSWHGSHVAGTVAQETNNAVRTAGLAFESQVMPIRVLGSCGGYGSDIAAGIVWASGGAVAGLPTNNNPAQVLNMSLGSRGPATCASMYQEAINGANSRGSIIVVAAGNSNGNAANYTMSSCSGVISVGATTFAGGKASYSNWGARIDISAPGGAGAADGNNGYVWQVINTGTQGPINEWTTGGYIGTSMASPHVAAVAAMVQGALAANDKAPLNWTQMRTLLADTARPFPVSIPSSTPMGPGIVDAHAAILAAVGGDEEPCDPAVEDCDDPGIVAIPLTNRVPVRGLSGAAGSEVLYSFQAEAGRILSITTSGGTGNVSLYVSFEEEPTTQSSDYRSVRPGNNEAVRINANNVRAGTYYIKLVGAAAYSGVTLEARQ